MDEYFFYKGTIIYCQEAEQYMSISNCCLVIV